MATTVPMTMTVVSGSRQRRHGEGAADQGRDCQEFSDFDIMTSCAP
jgi:hypothetical protein